jgi:hypothetical protein
MWDDFMNKYQDLGMFRRSDPNPQTHDVITVPNIGFWFLKISLYFVYGLK